MITTTNESPRSHTELAHRSIDATIANALDELHDRDRDDAADAIEPFIDQITKLAYILHDMTYADMTIKYDDTIPMTDDDADDLSYDLPDACDDATCCQRAHEMIYATLYNFDPRDLLPIPDPNAR